MSITSSNFIKASTLFFRDLFRSNLTDLQNPARTGSNWIFTTWPEATPTYPIIVIEPDAINDVRPLGQQSQGMLTEITMKISIFTKRVVDRDALSQDIHNQLRSNQLTASGSVNFQLFNMQTISTVNIDDDGADALHRRIFRVKYNVLLT